MTTRSTTPALLATLLAVSAHATPTPPPDQPHETAAPAPTGETARRLTPPARVARAGFTPVQVNTASGANIAADAANEPSLAVDPSAPNRIVIGWRQFDTISNSFRRAGYASSNDGGRTWSDADALQPSLFRSDPVLSADRNGNIFYSSLSVVGSTFSVQTFVTQDGGQTWSAPFDSFGGDKQWIAVDHSGGPSDGAIYQAWNTAGNMFFPNQFSRSFDAGQTWTPPSEIDLLPRFGSVTVDDNADVFVAGVTGSGQIAVARSTNASNPLVTPTFQAAIADLGGFVILGDGPNPAGLLSMLWVLADTSGGTNDGAIYLAGGVESAFSADPHEAHIIRSDDRGATWGPVSRINDDPPGTNAWQWLVAPAIAPSGRIDVVWYDTRNDPNPTFPQTSELFYSFSNDGGATWAPNTPITPPFNHFLGYPQQNKIGDYTEVISDDVGAHVTFSATFNGEQDVYYLRIGDYDCNANGVPDTDDIAAGTPDCNDNGIPDSCEIAAGTEADLDGNGIPDSCACAADLAEPAGSLDFFDILAFLDLFDAMDPLADIAPPAGVWDFLDLLEYLALFDLGCP